MALDKIRKRDGSVVPFEADKIAAAMRKAIEAVGEGEPSRAEEMTREVTGKLEARFVEEIPTVEEVQDLVEETLIEWGLPRTAKSYILYRERRAEIRRTKDFIGVRDELKLTVNAVNVLKKRYLLKADDHNVVETPWELFRRVARHSALDWNNAALPDDLRDIAELLNVAPDTADRLLRDIDAEND